MEGYDKKTELLVGLFFFVGLVLLGGIILQFSRIGEAFKDKYLLQVQFLDASGIVEGAPVKLGGAKIGKVSATPALNESFTGVVIDLEIFAGIEIPQGSRFLIGSSGLMGDKLVEIEPPGPRDLKEGVFIPPGSVIKGAGTSGLDAIGDAAEELSQKAQGVLEALQSVLEKLSRAIETLNTDFLGQQNAEHFKETLKKLADAMEKLESGVLGDENVENLKQTIASLKEAADHLKKESLELDPAIEDFRDSMSKIGTAAETATSTLQEIRTGKGLLATLISDQKLQSDLKSLIANLKKHGILRYKDTRPTRKISDPVEKKEKPKKRRWPWKRQ